MWRWIILTLFALVGLANAAETSPLTIDTAKGSQHFTVERARAFADSLGIRFPIWIDAGQRYGRMYAALGLPTTVILDRRGVVARGFDGPLTFSQMDATVAPLVRER